MLYNAMIAWISMGNCFKDFQDFFHFSYDRIRVAEKKRLNWWWCPLDTLHLHTDVTALLREFSGTCRSRSIIILNWSVIVFFCKREKLISDRMWKKKWLTRSLFGSKQARLSHDHGFQIKQEVSVLFNWFSILNIGVAEAVEETMWIQIIIFSQMNCVYAI